MTNRDITLLAAVLFGAVAALPGRGLAADILIENEGIQWKSGGGAANPLVVQAKPDDVIEIRVTGQHGFVTLDKPGEPVDQSPMSELKHVVMCGEDPASKPDAMLQEVECSRVNKVLKASMKLKVLSTFNREVNFWCIVHQDSMWGTIKP